MNSASKVLWGEGLFLRPQHFQQQDEHHVWRLAEATRSLHPYAHGVRSVGIDESALAAGRLRIDKVDLVFSDGECFQAPGNEMLPDELSLEAGMGTDSTLFVYLFVASMKGDQTNCAPTRYESGADRRYFVAREEALDRYTQAASATIETLKQSAVLVTASSKPTNGISMPLFKLVRTSTNGITVDRTFMPPLLSIRSSEVLFARLRTLLETLQGKVDALHASHREPTRNLIEFRSGDIASFWLLHTASAAHASLSHLFSHPDLHPERLFQRLLELVGALSTFSRNTRLGDLPVYDHADPGPGFDKLDALIRELLETVISTRCMVIELKHTNTSFHEGVLDPKRINERSRLYLGVCADMAAADLCRAVPQRFKIASTTDIEKLVSSALAGATIAHEPQVPSAIPVRPGTQYFSVDPRGGAYEAMLASGTLSIYAPQGIDGLKLDLFAIDT